MIPWPQPLLVLPTTYGGYVALFYCSYAPAYPPEMVWINVLDTGGWSRLS